MENHTKRLNGLLPTAAGIEMVESTLKSPLECIDWCFSNTLWEDESLLEPLFHLKDPMFGVKGKENLRFDSLPGVSGNLSFGLLLVLTLALAETVGTM